MQAEPDCRLPGAPERIIVLPSTTAPMSGPKNMPRLPAKACQLNPRAMVCASVFSAYQPVSSNFRLRGHGSSLSLSAR
jgi:hypothetical protein